MIFWQRIKFSLILVSLLFLWGCSLGDDGGGSVTFRVTGEMAQKIAGAAHSRSAVSANSPNAQARSLSAEDAEGLFIDILLKGGFSAARTIPAKEGATAEFDDIPVGKTLYAEAVAYRLGGDTGWERTVFYMGKSSSIRIRPGKNTLPLMMQVAQMLSVKVKFSEQNDLALSCEQDGTKFIFTAGDSTTTASGAEIKPVEVSSLFVWYVDGTAQEETSGTFTLETDGMNEGEYEIEVARGDKSAAATVTIE